VTSYPILRILSVDANSKLTTQCVGLLMQAAAKGPNSQLQKFSAKSCSIVAPLDTTFLDAISEKTNHFYPLTSISFTCQKFDQVRF